MARVGALKLGWLTCAMVSNALLLSRVLAYLAAPPPPDGPPAWTGAALVVAYIVVETGRSLFVNAHWQRAVLAGARARSAARALIYDKVLRSRVGGGNCSVGGGVSGGGAGDGSKSGSAGASGGSAGAIVTLLMGDTQRLLEACSYGEFIISTPITLLVTLVIMWTQVGAAALAGFAVLLTLAPMQAYIGRLVGRLRGATVRASDERAKVMAEVLSGIRLIKLCAWEGAFADKVARIRTWELRGLRRAALLRVANNTAGFLVPVLVTLVTFAAYTLATGEALEPTNAFVTLALFNVARFPLGILPQAVKLVSEARVAAARMQALLEAPDVDAEDMPVQLDRLAALAAAAVPGGPALRLPSPSLLALSGDAGIPAADVAVEARSATFDWPAPPPLSSSSSSAATKTGGSGGDSGIASLGKINPIHLASAPVTADLAQLTRVEQPASVLRDVTFTVRRGTCVAVVGEVGAGKSSLLAALLGQMRRRSGCFAVRGSVAFAPQSPWIFSASLRNNVLFGAPFDATRYAAVLRMCSLEADVAAWPAGDATELGERGLNASGGQKARIGLARAVYANRDILLLDDPLAAVDVRTARTLWHDCILRCAREGKTVLLATHAAHLVAAPDSGVAVVLVLAGGRLVDIGSPSDVLARGSLVLDAPSRAAAAAFAARSSAPAPATPMPATSPHATPASPETVSPQSPSPQMAAVAASSPQLSMQAAAPLPLFAGVSPESEATVQQMLMKRSESSSDRSAPGRSGSSPSPRGGGSAGGSPGSRGGSGSGDAAGARLVVAEEGARAVTLRTLALYVGAGGSGWRAAASLLALLGLLLLSRGARSASDVWVSIWTTLSAAGNTTVADERLYLAIYAAIIGGVLLAALAQGAAFALATLGASRALHDRVFAAVMRGTPAWFDSQPTGRILARFTADLDLVDSQIPGNLEQTAEMIATIALSLVLIVAVLPAFLLALLPMLALFLYVTSFFRVAARQLKRLDNLSRAPLVSHLQATLTGLETVRAFGAQARFVAANNAFVDGTAATQWAFYASNRWLACRLDNLTTLVAAATVAFCVAARGAIAPSLAALAIVQALQTGGIAQFSIRLFTETENQLTSVERLEHYSTGVPLECATAPGAPPLTEAEAEAAIAACSSLGPPILAPPPPPPPPPPAKPPKLTAFTRGWSAALARHAWPARGALAFEAVSARYRPGLPLALREVSFRVPPGASVGVVGRTGAGKTTLTLALFRMLELLDAPGDAPQGAAGCAAAGGRITLDGIDIARVNLYQLRSRLAILPQDPVLYAGTLQYNLDPFSAFSEAAIRACVQRAGLAAFVAAHPAGLARPVAEGGANVSQGERQLIALCRALLRGARVLVCDEATASVDDATDATVQRAIRDGAAGCTLLIIAHRLATVADCDRVLVLGGGRVLEYDHPAALLGLAPAREGPGASPGAFASLVRDTGAHAAAAIASKAVTAAAARSA